MGKPTPNKWRNTWIWCHVALVLLLTVGAVYSQPVIYSPASRRNVAISLTASSPPALSPSYAATNTPADPFALTLLAAVGQIDWQSTTNGTPPPTRGSAIQDAFFSATQISLSVDLLADVGGDPYGVRYATASSGEVSASSLFEVVFSVTVPMEYQYSFDFANAATLRVADLSLSSSGGAFHQMYRTAGTPQAGAFLLTPGEEYLLSFGFSATAAYDQVGYHNSTLTFEFMPVPEPNSSVLLLMGTALLGWNRWQSNKSKTRPPGRKAPPNRMSKLG